MPQKSARLLCALALLMLTSACNNHLVYHPTSETYSEPAALGLESRSYFIRGYDGVQLNLQHVALDMNAKPRALILHFHGNGENLSSHYLSLVWLTQHGFELLTVDYRGYGKSEGEPDAYGIYRDSFLFLEEALRLARERRTSLIVYGQSLGSAIAMRMLSETADRSQIRALVVEGSFFSLQKAASAILGRTCLWPAAPGAYCLISDRYAPEHRVADIAPTPMLIIHGERDRVIDIELGRQVFDAAREPKRWLPAPGAGHLVWLSPAANPLRTELVHFIEQAVAAH